MALATNVVSGGQAQKVRLTFAAVFRDKDLLDVFDWFLTEKLHSPELLEFYGKVSQLNQMTETKKIKEFITQLWDQYIDEDHAVQPIHVDHDLLNQLKVAKRTDPAFFDKVQERVYHLMEKDCFPRFRQSEYFKGYTKVDRLLLEIMDVVCFGKEVVLFAADAPTVHKIHGDLKLVMEGLKSLTSAFDAQYKELVAVETHKRRKIEDDAHRTLLYATLYRMSCKTLPDLKAVSIQLIVLDKMTLLQSVITLLTTIIENINNSRSNAPPLLPVELVRAVDGINFGFGRPVGVFWEAEMKKKNFFGNYKTKYWILTTKALEGKPLDALDTDGEKIPLDTLEAVSLLKTKRTGGKKGEDTEQDNLVKQLMGPVKVVMAPVNKVISPFKQSLIAPAKKEKEAVTYAEFSISDDPKQSGKHVFALGTIYERALLLWSIDVLSPMPGGLLPPDQKDQIRKTLEEVFATKGAAIEYEDEDEEVPTEATTLAQPADGTPVVDVTPTPATVVEAVVEAPLSPKPNAKPEPTTKRSESEEDLYLKAPPNDGTAKAMTDQELLSALNLEGSDDIVVE